MKKVSILAIMVVTLLFAGQNAFSVKPAVAYAGSSLSGTVSETMSSGGYTYILLDSSGTKKWVAVPKMNVKKGQKITLMPGAEMENFTSKTLNRTFDKIIFSGGPAAGSGAKDEMGSHSAGSKGQVVRSAEKIHVEKASGPNARTVAEIYGDAGSLDKKEAVVRGKVVKVSAGIMGKNWIHLQDGSGSPEKGTNDLVVTTQDKPEVGSVVTFSGTVFKDKDFGSGYAYKVIMENATLKK